MVYIRWLLNSPVNVITRHMCPQYRLDFHTHAALALLMLTNQGVDCSKHGTTLEALPIKKGYWRAAPGAEVVRKCPNKVW